MFKYILLITTLFSLALSNPQQVYNKCKKSVVVIYNPETEALGTGVFIHDNFIITNWHVVSKASSVLVAEHSPKYYNINQIPEADWQGLEVVAIDIERDLALIRSEKKVYQRSKKAKLGKKNQLSIGQPVVGIGNGGEGALWSLKKGNISQLINNYQHTIDQYAFNYNLIQHDTATNPGDSGGPLFNYNGELVGINTWKIMISENINFSITIDEVRDFIYKATKNLYVKNDTEKNIWDSNFINSPACSNEWKRHRGRAVKKAKARDEDQDGIYEKICIATSTSWVYCEEDFNHDDQMDVVMFWFDHNSANTPIGFELMRYNYARDQYIWWIDINYDGMLDKVGFDKNFDGEPDYFKSFEGDFEYRVREDYNGYEHY